jgi:hypothetical protein
MFQTMNAFRTFSTHPVIFDSFVFIVLIQTQKKWQNMAFATFITIACNIEQ